MQKRGHRTTGVWLCCGRPCTSRQYLGRNATYLEKQCHLQEKLIVTLKVVIEEKYAKQEIILDFLAKTVKLLLPCFYLRGPITILVNGYSRF